MRRDLGAGSRLPLSVLERTRACALTRRVADFAAHHGHPPDEGSTWSEWCAVTPALGNRLWAVAHALPLVYPSRGDDLLRVVVEVGYRTARRAQPPEPTACAAEALALTRRWLDGEPISSGVLHTAARRAAYAAADDALAADTGDAAAAYAAYAAAADALAAAAAYTADAAACAVAERAIQLQDLDELLAGLRLDAALERAYAGGAP